jgi:hypothetical protein
MKRTLIMAIVTLTLTACGTMVKARVSSFHNLPAQPSGLTFAVVPYQWQNGSLEFQTYAKAISTELQRKGFVAASLDQAQYVVFLAYAIDSGREVSYSYPIIGQTGVSSSYTSGTVQTYGNHTRLPMASLAQGTAQERSTSGSFVLMSWTSRHLLLAR